MLCVGLPTVVLDGSSDNAFDRFATFTAEDYDAVFPTFYFDIEDDMIINWNTNYWGNIRFQDILIDHVEVEKEYDT